MCEGVPAETECYTGRVKRDRRNPTTHAQRLKSAPRSPFDRRHLLVGLVFLVAFFTYSNSFRAPFLMDNAEILSDTRIHQATPENIDRIFHQSYHQSTLSGLYRPLTLL